MSGIEVAVRGKWRGDDGLSLVELIVALFIVSFAFAALASLVITSFASIRSNEARVAATALANEALEEMATVPWDLLGLYEGDEDLVAAIGTGDATYGGELLVLIPEDTTLPSGVLPDGVLPHLEDDIDRDGRTFEVERWVTFAEEDGGPDLKRMAVIVRWQAAGEPLELRTEGLRAPTFDDLIELSVSFPVLENNVAGMGNQVELSAETDSLYESVQAIRAEIEVGTVASTSVLTFRDRAGALRTQTSWAAESVDPVSKVATRTFLIPADTFTFRHGFETFTVTSTGADGQIASDTNSIRFFEDLVIGGSGDTPVAFTQGGTEMTAGVRTLEVCASTGLLAEPVTVDVTVAGMTPAEAAEDFDTTPAGDTPEPKPALSLTWDTQAADSDPTEVPTETNDFLYLDEPDPPLTHQDPVRTVEGGTYRFVLPETATFLAPSYRFRVRAERIAAAFDAFAYVDIPAVVSVVTCVEG